MLGSPPPWRAAMMIARLSLLHSLPRLASMAPFLCLMVAQWEWPDMTSPFSDRLTRCVLGLHLPEFLFQFPIMIVLAAPALALVKADRLAPRLGGPGPLGQAEVDVAQ